MIHMHERPPGFDEPVLPTRSKASGRSKNAASVHIRDLPWVVMDGSNTYVAKITTSYIVVGMSGV